MQRILYPWSELNTCIKTSHIVYWLILSHTITVSTTNKQVCKSYIYNKHLQSQGHVKIAYHCSKFNAYCLLGEKKNTRFKKNYSAHFQWCWYSSSWFFFFFNQMNWDWTWVACIRCKCDNHYATCLSEKNWCWLTTGLTSISRKIDAFYF